MKTPLEYINKLPSPVLIKDIDKLPHSGYYEVLSILLIDGDRQLHYLTYHEYDLSLFGRFNKLEFIR